MLWKTSALKGLHIISDDGDAGVLEQLLFDDRNGAIRYIVIDIDTHHAYKRKLLSPIAVYKISKNGLHVKVSSQLLRNSPDIDTAAPVSRQMEEALHKYYSLPCYWLFPESYTLLGGAIYPGISIPYAYPAAGDDIEFSDIYSRESHLENTSSSSHLRLTNEVKGYLAIATDGEIGPLVDVFIDDKQWIIKFLIMDTGHFFPGRKVLLPYLMVKKIEWTNASINVSADRKTIRESPVYNQEYPVTEEFAKRLLGYYNPEKKQ
jgi:hypothetical protein